VASQAFVANDRGCLPILATTASTGAGVTGASQSTTTQMTLGSLTGSTLGSILNDVNALQSSLCVTYGTCCYSNNCNPASRIVYNPLSLIAALLIGGVVMIKQVLLVWDEKIMKNKNEYENWKRNPPLFNKNWKLLNKNELNF
jgi:hypothetical protein